MTGVWRALLIGSQTGKLQGADRDAQRMGDTLARQGFTALTVLTGARASRDGILGAYEALIQDARRDDVVCIYYSGHGNLAPNPRYQRGQRTPPVLQYLIPTDDGPGEFRGIMSFELSQLLGRLTAQTHNVTVLLDCCHSARMSRAAQDLRLVPKAGTSRIDDQALADLLAKSLPQEAFVDVESNPYAVRLVAAEAQSLAFERLDEQGQATGAFTEALLQAFAERGGERVAWNTLMLRVRELVMARIPDQRPDVEGPRRRRIWGLDEADEQRPLALYFEGQQPRIRGGALLGVVAGATYGIMPAGAEAYASERALATATVEESLGAVARVRLEPGGQAALPRTGLLAFPLTVPFRRCDVVVSPEVSPAVRARLAASRYLAPVDAGGGPAPAVTMEGGDLVLHDAFGDRLLQTPEASLEPLVARLECLARAEDLRRMEPGALDADLAITFGRIVNDDARAMEEGETLHVGDRQFIRVENDGSGPRYVAVLGIDASYDVQLVSLRAPRGQRLAQKERLVVGENAYGNLPGVEVSWPSSLPRDRPRRESIIVIASGDEQDFLLLTTGTRSRGGTPSALEQRLAQIRAGGARSRGGDAGGAEYRLWRVDYQLSPEPRPA